jgi:hypothetical protein
MRARFAISIIAVIGVLFTVGAGAAFAQGIGGTDSAGQQQYGTTTPAPPVAPPTTTPSETDVLGEIGEVEESQPAPATTEEAAPAPAPAPAPQAAAQPAQEQSGQLPFTGFATLAVVLLGVALLMGGLVLRRTTREQRNES